MELHFNQKQKLHLSVILVQYKTLNNNLYPSVLKLLGA